MEDSDIYIVDTRNADHRTHQSSGAPWRPARHRCWRGSRHARAPTTWHPHEAKTGSASMGKQDSRLLPVRRGVARLLAPRAEGDGSACGYPQGDRPGHSLFCRRRPRSHRPAYRLCPTHVAEHGPRFLALGTLGTWREGQTPLAQRAAQGTPVCQPGAVSPAALHQRLPKQALALLQARLRQGLATLPSLTPVGDAGRCAAVHQVSLADSPGFARPDDLDKTWPGAGGRAATAGAKRQAVWDDTRRLLDPVALTPWNLPDQRAVATGVALAHKGI